MLKLNVKNITGREWEKNKSSYNKFCMDSWHISLQYNSMNKESYGMKIYSFQLEGHSMLSDDAIWVKVGLVKSKNGFTGQFLPQCAEANRGGGNPRAMLNISLNCCSPLVLWHIYMKTTMWGNRALFMSTEP